MKELKCSHCGKVVIKLFKGSEVIPNLYILHSSCKRIIDEYEPEGDTMSPFDMGLAEDGDFIADFLGLVNKKKKV